jgi:predicted nucleic acid-binding protein
MDLLIDANILFAILIKERKTEEILLHENIHAFAPEFLLDEFKKYEQLITEKTSRRHEEFQELIDILKKRIIIISNKETQQHIKEARKISPDKKDVDYFALALKLNCAIWSNDQALKKQEKNNDIHNQRIAGNIRNKLTPGKRKI